jgi:5'-nucleotidase
MGYEPRICSGPIKENPTCIEDKLAWLEEYMVPKFGRYVVETAILNGKKAEYDGIALIDDKPEVKDSEQANWTHIVWTQSYNKDIETDFRLDRWDGGQLKDVLRRARQRYVDLGKLAITK